MRTHSMVGALLVLATSAEPAAAQRVSADVSVRSGPVAGRVVVDRGYSSYTGEPVVVYRRPARRVVIVERYRPEVIVVHRFRHHGHWKHWRRHGYRPVAVYYAGNGRYLDRHRPGFREVVVFERHGRYYRGWDDGRRYYVDDRDDWDDDRDDWRDRYRDRDDWDD